MAYSVVGSTVLLHLSILSICFLRACCPPIYHILTGSSNYIWKSFLFPPVLFSPFLSFLIYAISDSHSYCTHIQTSSTHTFHFNHSFIHVFFIHSPSLMQAVSSSLRYDLLPLHYYIPFLPPSLSPATTPARREDDLSTSHLPSPPPLSHDADLLHCLSTVHLASTLAMAGTSTNGFFILPLLQACNWGKRGQMEGAS